MRNKFSAAILLTSLALLPLVGCGTKDALTFNEAMVGANKKLNDAGTDLGKAVVQAIGGGPEDVAAARQSYEKARATLQQVKSDMESAHVPSSESAQALHDAHQKFLQGQERFIEKDFKEIVLLLEDSKVSKSERAQKIQAIFTRIGSEEQTDLAALKTAQMNFAKEYNLKLQ